MNFKDATDAVCAALGHEDVAKALGVSVQTVRQARLSPDGKAYREPPAGWPAQLIKLAEKQANHYRKLVERLQRQHNL
jgi:hypothetical protein